MQIDLTYLGLLGRVVLINIAPFFIIFHLVLSRRIIRSDPNFSELKLIAREIKAVGLLGYFVIISIYFFSIPVLRYISMQPGYDILLVEPDGFTVYLIAFISFSMVVFGIYLKERKMWAYRSLVFVMNLLLVYAFFTILEFGLISVVPVAVFSYLLYRLTRKSLLKELLTVRHSG